MNISAAQKLLGALAVALAVGLGWLTDWGQGFGEPDIKGGTPTTKPDGASVLPDFKLSSESSAYAQIAERPLLNPTRRPAPTQAAVAVAPEPPKPQIRRGLYQLVGVSDFGGMKVAQLRELATGRTRSVKQGDSLQEMQVTSLDINRVTLGFQGETDILELAKYTSSGRVPQPPAPPPPAVAVAPPPVQAQGMQSQAQYQNNPALAAQPVPVQNEPVVAQRPSETTTPPRQRFVNTPGSRPAGGGFGPVAPAQ
ncbi:MAG: hypothetical protein EAZ43_01845 [Betaproteobacteria bacterium]|nr:MAG: hypothetical protein EAZ43_01845 [Betaproteobacteria bacterium]